MNEVKQFFIFVNIIQQLASHLEQVVRNNFIFLVGDVMDGVGEQTFNIVLFY